MTPEVYYSNPEAVVRCVYRTDDVCASLCRHQPGQQSTGCVCPWAERQDVADHGPAPFIPESPGQRDVRLGVRPGIDFVASADGLVTGGVVPQVDGLGPFVTDAAGNVGPAPVGEFGRAAQRTLAEVRETFDTRGNSYGDTWRVDDGLSEPERLRDARALVRVKLRRSQMTGHTHRDSLVDLIAYAAAYVTWADEAGAWS